jgi:hypothetical protein
LASSSADGFVAGAKPVAATREASSSEKCVMMFWNMKLLTVLRRFAPPY